MIVKLDNIHKSYLVGASNIKNDVLKDISLSMDTGEYMTIIGPSGCGKSTLLNIIGTIDKPSSGSVLFDGNKIENYTEHQLANIRNQEIGFIFQSHHLLPQLNLIENILLPTIPIKDRSQKKLALERAHMMLEEVGLSKNIHQFPSQLSGGECQRVAVVRALINQPKLILADEPTGSLDEESTMSIGNLLTHINKEYNTALIVVTHSISLANMIGNIFNLTGGKLTSA